MSSFFRTVSKVRAIAGLGMMTWVLSQPSPVAAQTEMVEYYAADAVGSVRVVYDASGNVLGRMDYAPFGEELYTGLFLPSERFAQLARDGEAGQDYAQARMYQARTGRHTMPDPVYAGLFDSQRWNRYSYALGNPLKYLDPSGLIPVLNIDCYHSDPGYRAEFKCRSDLEGVGGSDGTLALPQPTGGGPIGPVPGPLVDPGPGDNGTGDPGDAGNNTGQDPKPECEPGFIESATKAWIRAGIGFTLQEAGFWIVEDKGKVEYRPTPFTNQVRRLTLRVPQGVGIIGLFHTHPNNSVQKPSLDDIITSNTLKRPVFVGSRNGLWVHQPGTRESERLRPDLTWTKPCKN